MLYRFVAISLALAFTVSCVPQVGPTGVVLAKTGPKTKFKQHEVLFRVHQGTLEPHPGNNGNKGCQGVPGSDKGCVDFSKGTLGVLRLNMQGGNAIKTCADTPKPDYVIIEVKISPVGSDNKGQFPPPNPAPDWLAAAFPTLDPATGVVYEAEAYPVPPSTNIASEVAEIINLNNNDAQAAAKDIWYRVKVEDCEDGTKIESDPRIKNHGN